MPLTNWFDSPGQDGRFWRKPFQTGANWITSGSLVTALQNGNNSSPTGYVHLPSDFSVPVAQGKSTDPVVNVSGGGSSINVHIPVGYAGELPVTGTDNGTAGFDETQPGVCWTGETSIFHPTGPVQSSGTSITCNQIAIDWAFGPFMEDTVTGQPGTGNAWGAAVQDWELTALNADPNYVIPHMMAYSLDPTQILPSTLAWPLAVPDNSFSDTGSLVQGLTVGIPASTPRPTGETRGFYAWFDQLQHFGAFYYNVSGNGCFSTAVYPVSSANNALANDMKSALSRVMAYVCILNPGDGPNYTSGPAGSQYSVATAKGATPGSTDAFPRPAPLDLSPLGTGAHSGNYQPSNFNYTAILPPTGLAASSITSTGCTLNWNAVSGAANYIVWRNGVIIAQPTSNSFSVSGLSPSTAYTFWVQSSSGVGAGDSGVLAGNTVSVTTTAAGTAPGQPTGLTVGTVTETSVALSWTAPTSGSAATGYIIWGGIYNPSGGTGLTQIGTSTGTSFRANGLTAGTAYVFTVQGTNSYGTGPQSLSASATTLPEIQMTTAVPCNTFLGSIGVNTFMSQGVPYTKYTALLEYTGIRNIRENISAASSILSLAGTYPPLKANVGIPGTATNADLTSAVASAANLATAGCLLSFEGANEPNNFTISWNGVTGGGTGDWTPVAEMQAAWYAAVQANSTTAGYPVFTITEPGAEQTNVGLQFLTIPAGSGLSMPDGTVYATHANCHNYVISAAGYADNIAWNNADPTWTAGPWDALYPEFGLTWLNHYTGYTLTQLATLPRVTTETGWDDVADPAGPGGARWTQGVVLTNQYLAQFKQGWSYTFVYNFVDGEGGSGNYGFYDSSLNPKDSATFLHNMTTILADTSSFTPGTLSYTIPSEPATVHDLLLQKANGTFELVVWGESAAQTASTVTVNLGQLFDVVNIYDITVGTTPTQTLTGVSSVSLTITDHAMIIELPVNTVTPASVQAQITALETAANNLNALLVSISSNVGQL